MGMCHISTCCQGLAARFLQSYTLNAVKHLRALKHCECHKQASKPAKKKVSRLVCETACVLILSLALVSLNMATSLTVRFYSLVSGQHWCCWGGCCTRIQGPEPKKHIEEYTKTYQNSITCRTPLYLNMKSPHLPSFVGLICKSGKSSRTAASQTDPRKPTQASNSLGALEPGSLVQPPEKPGNPQRWISRLDLHEFPKKSTIAKGICKGSTPACAQLSSRWLIWMNLKEISTVAKDMGVVSAEGFVCGEETPPPWNKESTCTKGAEVMMGLVGIVKRKGNWGATYGISISPATAVYLLYVGCVCNCGMNNVMLDDVMINPLARFPVFCQLAHTPKVAPK